MHEIDEQMRRDDEVKAWQDLGAIAAARFLRFEYSTLRATVTAIMCERGIDNRNRLAFEDIATLAVSAIHAGETE